MTTRRGTVGLADDRRADNARFQVEVARQLRHHLELLVVFLAEDRDVGFTLNEQLGDNSIDASKKVRPVSILEADRRRALRYDTDGEAGRIHCFR